MQVAGIDPSLTGTAVTLAWNVSYERSVFSSKPQGDSVRARIDRINNQARDAAMFCSGSDVVAIEGYSFASSTNREKLAEYGALLRMHLFEQGCRVVYEVPPLTLKKWATGKGSGDKTALIAAIARRYDVQFASNDEYDSFALAQLAMQLAGLSEPETAYQRECVDKILNPVKKTKKRKAG